MKLQTLAAVLLFATSAIQADPVRVVQREGGGDMSDRGGSFSRPGSVSHGEGDTHDNRYEHPRTVTHKTSTRVVRRTYTPQRHDVVVHNRTIIRDIHRNQRVEMVPNRYYWHTVGGVRYAHTFRGGIHWYGFYHGPNFYWSRYYLNNWWWYDAAYSRWAFWTNGYWWWPGPGGVMYVYVNDNYYPYESADVPVPAPSTIPAAPGETASPSAAGQTESQDSSLVSPDKVRMVQIVGANSDAFLYDNTPPKPVFMKSLGSGVTNVRFAGGHDNKPLQILVDYSDGHFTMFDKTGEVLQNSEASAPAPQTSADSQEPPIPPPGL